VVVIADQLVLDRQLQETICEFEHAHRVFEKIDKDFQQLADALASEQARIIIATLRTCSATPDGRPGTLAPRVSRAPVAKQSEGLVGYAVGDGEHFAAAGLQVDLGAQQPGRHSLDDAPFPDRGCVKARARRQPPRPLMGIALQKLARVLAQPATSAL
jgi:hypothetical protein